MTRALPASMAMDCSDYAVIYRDVLEAIDGMPNAPLDWTDRVDHIYGAAGSAMISGSPRGDFIRVAALAILAVEQIDRERHIDRVKRKRRRP